MKIAIQGHPTRGKEIIQILENLGGKNEAYLRGNSNDYYYIDDDNLKGIIRCDGKVYLKRCYKKYTLEEFEKEFPFKVGDKVTIITDIPYKIVALEYYMGRLCYRLDNGLNYNSEALTLYKEMKEERNITLTLDKAKEWYNKGGELKEIALQAFTEKELNPLPRSWEEFCETHPIKKDESYITNNSTILTYACSSPRLWSNVCPSENSAIAHLAMIQLEQLRDCWRQGWIPETHEAIYAIKFSDQGLNVYNFISREFLSFPTMKMAEEFLKCFRDLIEQAGDLI